MLFENNCISFAFCTLGLKICPRINDKGELSQLLNIKVLFSPVAKHVQSDPVTRKWNKGKSLHQCVICSIYFHFCYF